MTTDGYLMEESTVEPNVTFQVGNQPRREHEVVGFASRINEGLVDVITGGNTVFQMHIADGSELHVGDAVQVDGHGHATVATIRRADPWRGSGNTVNLTYDTPLGGFSFDRPNGSYPPHPGAFGHSMSGHSMSARSLQDIDEKVLKLDAKLTEIRLVIRKLYRRPCEAKICGTKSDTPAEYCEFHNELAVLLAHLEE